MGSVAEPTSSVSDEFLVFRPENRGLCVPKFLSALMPRSQPGNASGLSRDRYFFFTLEVMD